MSCPHFVMLSKMTIAFQRPQSSASLGGRARVLGEATYQAVAIGQSRIGAVVSAAAIVTRLS